MKLTVVKSFNTILEEEAIHILFHNNHKIYEASGLFFKWNEIKDETKIKTLETVELDENIPYEDLINLIIELEKKYGLQVYECTFKSLLHWIYMNEAILDKNLRKDEYYKLLFN